MTTGQSRSGETLPHLTLSITTPTPEISLSAPPDQTVLLLTVRARCTSTIPLTLCTVGSVLDNGQHVSHDGVFKGAFTPLTSTSDPTRKIQLHFSGWPNYGTRDASENLLERDYLRFETVPGKDDQGGDGLTITHSLSLDRLFSYSNLRKGSVQPGEKFALRMNPKKLRSLDVWWTWGDLEADLKGKKFTGWEVPDEHGEIRNLEPGEEVPDVEGMKREGWVFTEYLDDLVLHIEEGEGEEVVVVFVE